MAEASHLKTMSYAELSLRSGLSVRTLKRLVRQRAIPHIRYTSSSVRFDKVEVEAWIKSRSVPAQAAEEKTA